METYADEVGAPDSRETADLGGRVSRLMILWTKKRSGSPSQAPDSSVSTSSAAVAAVSGDGVLWMKQDVEKFLRDPAQQQLVFR
ncbi:uncharacterized protein A4U43_C10F17200 [Asparagus officinalis]|uniref:Uncharacterized protein n=1 Tax=Asparagus officinalis TaxID=4686 RepID=A0A5P1E3Q1_ASPOF|nr:uncharacterized protein A4U43_C10F17200 [Asparagus officinalis]